MISWAIAGTAAIKQANKANVLLISRASVSSSLVGRMSPYRTFLEWVP